MSYVIETFYPKNIEHAKDICLTPDQNDPNKFVKETEFFVDFMKSKGYLDPDMKVADFGCGVGRVAKKIVDDIGCSVTGFDISFPMLACAIQYVKNSKFTATLYSKEKNPVGFDESFDTVFASLVLQHSPHPKDDIQYIRSIMKYGAYFVLVNEPHRYVPTGVDGNGFVKWTDDGIDILGEVEKNFNFIGEYDYYTRKDKCLSVWQK